MARFSSGVGLRPAIATCPRVAHVQRLVEQAEQEGRQPVMIGDPGHPEVRGVAGWCRSLLVFSGAEETARWVETAGAGALGGLSPWARSKTLSPARAWSGEDSSLIPRCSSRSDHPAERSLGKFFENSKKRVYKSENL